MLWKRVSSKAYTGFLRASIVVFKAEFYSVFELTNRVAVGREPHHQAVINSGADHPFRSAFRLPSYQTQPLTHEVNPVLYPVSKAPNVCQRRGNAEVIPVASQIPLFK